MPAEVVERVVRTLTDRLAASAGDPDEDAAAQRRRASALLDEELDRIAADALSSGRRVLAPEQEAHLRAQVLARVCGLGGLEALLAEPGVQNINITGERVVVDFGGGRREQRPPVAAGDADLIALVRRIAATSGTGERRFDASAPLLSMELGDGSRLSAVMDVSRRVAVAIRRHPDQALTMDDLQASGMVDATARRLLAAAVGARLNVLIAGATGAGKTTLLRALAYAAIPPTERLITIEDSLELGLDRAHPECVAMQARPANIEGAGEITLAELVRHALRMSPDRVIVGETRGPETIALLNAMSMGTDGSMATIHASSSQGAFTKIAAYTAQAPERLGLEATNLLIASAVHLVVHIASGPHGARRVASIREVVGAEGAQVASNEIYRRTGGEPGALVVPPGPATATALAACGFDSAREYAGGAW
ncbi:CpaF family protein [Nocardiopsis composta]|uniref:Flp pilus assembly CpaF family ATPase n=1 Tax=Nocardiopsis composta TaxID=157465 RepID=A0A7W8VG29_9ACTN|nr:ATPase, T2SS/T4P/T4SS family [Nocardiopsis composta]MBB5435206.1 Flp pilus assembly CpaF family ATPase [Nocardiopsis composta]